MLVARLAAVVLVAATAGSAALALASLSPAAAGAPRHLQATLKALRGGPWLATAVEPEPLRDGAQLQRNAGRQEAGRAGDNGDVYEQCESDNSLLGPARDCAACLTDGTCEEGACCAQVTSGRADQVLVCPPGSCCVRVLVTENSTVAVVEALSIPAAGTCGDAAPDDACVPCGIALSADGPLDCPNGIPVPGASEPLPEDLGRCVGDPEPVGATSEADVSEGIPGASEEAESSELVASAEPAADANADDEDDFPAPDSSSEDTVLVPVDTGVPASDDGEEELESLLDEIFACFPASATVELEGGAVVPIDSIAIGDSVKVGKNKFSNVFMFTHRLGDVFTEFVILNTASGEALALTGGHYIYSNGELVSANTVRVGDELSLGGGGTSHVIRVEREMRSGLYNPQTVDGNIVVDGVLASTYTTGVEPGLAHLALAPLRTLSRFGVSFGGLESGGGALVNMVPRGLNRVV